MMALWLKIRFNNRTNISKQLIVIYILICGVYFFKNFYSYIRSKKNSHYKDAGNPNSNIIIEHTKNIRIQTSYNNASRIASRQVMNAFSNEYEELSKANVFNTSLHEYSIRQIVFTFTTNTKRIRQTIHIIKFWATKPGVLCLIIFENKDFQSSNDINIYLSGQGISCKIKVSNISRYEERYLELVEQVCSLSMKNPFNNTEKIEWFVFGDDDTVWFLDNLIQILKQYNASDSLYLGNISDKLGAIQNHGTYYAYGGGGIILSRPLALRMVQNMKSCRRYRHFYGGDQIIGKCITEVLKINLTSNKNFHQMDHEGDMDGFFESGIEGLVSLHHMFTYWEPFPVEHTIHPQETIYLLELAYKNFGLDFLKRYVRKDYRTNRTYLLTMGYSFSVFNRILTNEELSQVEKTWWCCSEYVYRKSRPKEKNKISWYFRDIIPENNNTITGYGAIYENKRQQRPIQYPRIEIFVKN